METTGGVSVSDLVEKHTGSRPNFAPVEPPQRAQPAPTQPQRAIQPKQTPPQRAIQPKQSPPRPAQRPASTSQQFLAPAARNSGQFRTPVEPPPPTRPRGNATGSHPVQPKPAGPAPVPQSSARLPQARQAAPSATTSQRMRIPSQKPPGLSSMPPRPANQPERAQPAAEQSHPSFPQVQPVARRPVTPPPPAPVRETDLVCLTTEMEAIGEATQKRRKVDQTLARFSKVHDELRAEERERKAKRRFKPRSAEDAELDDRLDELGGGTVVTPVLRPSATPAALEEAPTPTRLRQKKARRQQRSTLIAKIFAGVLALLVFVVTGAAWGRKMMFENQMGSVDALDENSSSIVNADGQRGDENFLLVGSDTRAGAKPEDHVGTDTGKGAVIGARSDSVMVAHIPADRKRVVVVSFPRDLEITRPACQRFDSKSGHYTGEEAPQETAVKLNTAYEVGGPKCVTKVVQQLSGLKINHFIGIDFNGFKDMVDVAQGVQVCIERPMWDEELGWVVKDPGKDVTLTGDQALNFVRARHVYDSPAKLHGDPTSDYGRIKRQQRFLSSLLRKAMSGSMLTDPGKLNDFLSAFAKATVGDNVGLDQLATLGGSLHDLDAGHVTFVTVPTTGTSNSRGNEVLRDKDNKSLFDAIIGHTPLPGEAPAAPDGKTTQPTTPAQGALVDPKSVKIQVQNGGNTAGGIARKTADKLSAQGFQLMTPPQNALESVTHTVVKYAAGHEDGARTLAAAVPGATMEQDSSLAGALLLVIGPEYTGSVVAPSAGGTAAPATAPTTAQLPKDLATVNAGDISCS